MGPKREDAGVGGEGTIDPSLPVVDAHHHLFDRADDVLARITGRRRFLIDEYTESVGGDHKLLASVAVEVNNMYRASGPPEMRVVNETEFLSGQAAMGATALYGGIEVAAGIVGGADLRLGDAVEGVLESHLLAAPARFKGIRQFALWDPDPTVLGGLFGDPSIALGLPAQLYADTGFRRGFRHLAPLGLSFDAFVLAPQIPEVTALARDFPETRIVLDHLGQPVNVGAHASKLEEGFRAWERSMRELSDCPNVSVKMGGLGSYLAGFPSFRSEPPAGSDVLADQWRPYVETTVELFGADRVMFESNLPTDSCGAFNVVCNAFKRLLAGCSAHERGKIFAGTAVEVYRLELDLEASADGGGAA